MPSNTMRMAIIGAGSIADVGHIPAILRNPGTELAAICDANEKIAQKMAAKWGLSAWYTDYREMLEGVEIDAAIIATPNRTHYEIALACAEHGIHTVLEKPMTVTNGEAWALVAAFEQAGVKLMIGCDRRFWEQAEIAKRLIEEGLIGEVKMAKGTMHETWQLYQGSLAVSDFRLKLQEAGGGTLLDQGSHKLDQVRWLVGSEARRVVGLADRRATQHTEHEPDDVSWALIEFESGATACVSTNKFSPAVTETTEVYGTEGTIFLSSDAINPYQTVPLALYTHKDFAWDELPEILRLHRYPEIFWPEDLIAGKVRKKWVTISPPREWSYERMLRHFLDCLATGQEPLVDGTEGAKVMDIICGVFESMRTGGWVELPLTSNVIPPGYRGGTQPELRHLPSSYGR